MIQNPGQDRDLNLEDSSKPEITVKNLATSDSSVIIEPGSGPLGAVAQASWLGHPAQASDLPANSDWGPGQSIDHQHNQTIRN